MTDLVVWLLFLLSVFAGWGVVSRRSRRTQLLWDGFALVVASGSLFTVISDFRSLTASLEAEMKGNQASTVRMIAHSVATGCANRYRPEKLAKWKRPAEEIAAYAALSEWSDRVAESLSFGTAYKLFVDSPFSSSNLTSVGRQEVSDLVEALKNVECSDTQVAEFEKPSAWGHNLVIVLFVVMLPLALGVPLGIKLREVQDLGAGRSGHG